MQNMVFFEPSFEDDVFKVRMTDAFYKIMTPYFVKDKYCSYGWIFYRLFNLLPKDFYHYIGRTYNATFKANKLFTRSISVFFTNKKDITDFCNECNKRMNNFLEKESNNA